MRCNIDLCRALLTEQAQPDVSPEHDPIRKYFLSGAEQKFLAFQRETFFRPIF